MFGIGQKRLDTALADYLGAKRDKYSAMCLRLFLFGSFERVYKPGCQFDYMLIFKGAQGVGKSTFFRKMCQDVSWYQDDLNDISNRSKAFDMTNGKWIVEMGELTALRKAEIDSIKGYITTKNETHRVPYETTAKDFPRQFVLLGTTNSPRFLVDKTGDRRFLIVPIAQNKDEIKRLKKSVFSENAEEELKQILAEAFYEYKNGKKFLQVPAEFEEETLQQQIDSREDDPIEGIIQGYLNKVDYTCTLQIWIEALGHDRKDKMTRKDISNITQILAMQDGWRLYSGNLTHRKRLTSEVFGDYGSQLCYENYKKIQAKEDKELNAQKQKTTDIINKYKSENLTSEEYWKKIGKGD